MRTLVIAGEYPWPENAGSRIRLAMVLRGLQRCGPTELFSVVSKFRDDFDPPGAGSDLAALGRVGFDNLSVHGLGLVSTLARPAMPLALPWHDRDRVQRALARFMSGHYDLVWFFGPRPWVLTGMPRFAPAIVDLDDLEDRKIEGRLAVPRQSPPGRVGRMRRTGSDLVAAEEMRRWRRLYRQTGARASAVVVCSQLDADRAGAHGVRRVRVIPNGYPVPAHPAGRTEVGTPPVVLFAGLLRYPPNIDAARWLAHDVGPALRALVPEVEIRLVGDHPPALAALDDRPRVTVTGRVPDIGAELARADLVTVPVRYGSGTRLKILEAFAHRLPVASTTLGAEGIGARDGVHLLVGDTATELASACARLLADPALRRSVVTNAGDLFLERFQTGVIEEQVAELAREVAGREAR